MERFQRIIDLPAAEDPGKQVLAVEDRGETIEAWLAATLRNVGEGIIATDTSGEIVFMNPFAEKLTGWSAADAHGCVLMNVLGLFEESAESKLEPAGSPIFNLLAGESRSYTLISKTAEHTIVEVECFENRSAEELLGSIVVVRDISGRREVEGRLLQSQTMEAIANMAGGVAHDFNNQLMVIQGYADELCTRLSGEDRQQALEIKRAASIAGSLTGNLLTLSRRDVARQEVLNVNEVIREAQPLISHSLGENRKVATELGSPMGFIRGDRSQLKQVLMNLALHARDGMPARGELSIESSILEIDLRSLGARMYRPGWYVRLRVVDTGEGVDKATLARIFEPFIATQNTKCEFGLGLSIVHSIVIQSGGYISATSKIGEGTRFEILLPCVGSFHTPGEVPGSGSEDAENPAPTVLLVEDEDSVRRLMHKFLAREGYQLLEARNAVDAEAIANVFYKPIHVLVTDVVMPGMTGLELAARLTALRPELKVLFVSGYRHDTLEHHSLWNRELNLLPKPFPESELLRRVQILLKQ